MSNDICIIDNFCDNPYFLDFYWLKIIEIEKREERGSEHDRVREIIVQKLS